MKHLSADVLVCGGGISGLLTSKALVNLGLHVVCVEKRKEEFSTIGQESDGRSTALLAPSIKFINELGIWSSLSKKAQALESLIICNLNSEKGLIDQTCEFFANDLGLECLGYNIPNDLLRSEIKNSLTAEKNFLFLDNVAIENLIPRTKEIIALTNKKQKISVKLVIGADGKNSTLRQLAKIRTFGFEYRQQALVFSMQHELNHEAKSFEIYQSGGPCTLVPLKTASNNGYFSSVVLMERPEEIKKIISLNTEKISEFISNRTGMLLGDCRIKTDINKFPAMSMISTKFTSDRLILLAEAAHVMPPIGAQGLNTSVQDIMILTNLLEIEKRGAKDFGDKEFLVNYEKARLNKIRQRIIGVHLLNKISMTGSNFTVQMRKLGLKTLKNNSKARKFLMKVGMYENFQLTQ